VNGTSSRPQDRLVLRPGAAQPHERVIDPHSVALWTALSLPLVGYFFWYHRALRDCNRLLEDSSDPWFWLAMVFPGMILVIPYAVAQARLVARVEVASRRPLPTIAYLALCVGGFLIPALMPLVLQPRLNQAARTVPAVLRRTPIG
jgi:hypothetical protein